MKRLLLFIIIILVFIFSACHNVIIDTPAPLYSTPESAPPDDRDMITRYEYSFTTQKGNIITEVRDVLDTQYISLGKPDGDCRSNNGLSMLKEDEGKVYLVNGFGLYELESQYFKPFNSISMCYIDVQNGSIIYFSLQDYGYFSYYTDISQSALIVNATDAVIACDHIFYIGVNDKIYRMTIYHHENIELIPHTPVSSIKYCNGWIYYLYKDSIWRVDVNGENDQQITSKNNIYEYYLYNNRISFITKDMRLFLITDNQIAEMTIPEAFGPGSTGLPSIIGVDEKYIYLMASVVDNPEKFIMINDNNESHVFFEENLDDFYSPELLNGYIYYYSGGKLNRIYIETKETEVVGGEYNSITYE